MSSDWQTFERARAGEATAWRELVASQQPRLIALALFVTGAPTLVDDIVQETFVRALQAKVTHRSGTVESYLGTIAFRLAVKAGKAEKRQVGLSEAHLPAADSDPLQRILREERDCQVAHAIEGLSVEQREVLLLRFYGEQSYEEIARTLQVPLGTVKSRIFKAVKSCREALRRKGVLE